MLHSSRTMKDYTIYASDGELGKLEGLLFEVDTWVVRYLVVRTGYGRDERCVLLSPIAVCAVNDEQRAIAVAVRCAQVQSSPTIDVERPISRQMEEALCCYYNYPFYWDEVGLWGTGLYPTLNDYAQTRVRPQPHANETATGQPPTQTGEPHGAHHLHSMEELTQCHLHAWDGNIGHVSDVLVQDTTWAIRYFVVDIGNWPPARKVLVAPCWVQRIGWDKRIVAVNLRCEALRQAPTFDALDAVTCEYEARLHEHYQQLIYRNGLRYGSTAYSGNYELPEGQTAPFSSTALL